MDLNKGFSEGLMSNRLHRSRYLCRIGMLTLAILMGLAARPMTDRAVIAEFHVTEPEHSCLI